MTSWKGKPFLETLTVEEDEQDAKQPSARNRNCRASNKGGRENDYLHSNGRLRQQMSLSKCHNGCEKMNARWKGQMSLNIPTNAVVDVTLPA